MTETSSHVPTELTDTRRSRPFSIQDFPTGPTASASFHTSNHLTAPLVDPYRPSRLEDVCVGQMHHTVFDFDGLREHPDVDRDDLNL